MHNIWVEESSWDPMKLVPGAWKDGGFEGANASRACGNFVERARWKSWGGGLR